MRLVINMYYNDVICFEKMKQEFGSVGLLRWEVLGLEEERCGLCLVGKMKDK